MRWFSTLKGIAFRVAQHSTYVELIIGRLQKVGTAGSDYSFRAQTSTAHFRTIPPPHAPAEELTSAKGQSQKCPC